MYSGLRPERTLAQGTIFGSPYGMHSDLSSPATTYTDTQGALRTASASWWRSIKREPAALLDWLRKQYHGEHTAAWRIEEYATAHVPDDSRWRAVLETIAAQERQHAGWVGELLRTRGENPTPLDKEERYWRETLQAIDSLETGAAVAAHAENMRLARIEVIAGDQEPDAPADIRDVFARILTDERFHARAFTAMAGDAALAKTRENHARGLAALGLINPDEVL